MKNLRENIIHIIKAFFGENQKGQYQQCSQMILLEIAEALKKEALKIPNIK